MHKDNQRNVITAGLLIALCYSMPSQKGAADVSVLDYIGRVESKIQQSWKAPAGSTSVSVCPTIRFHISPEGRVGNVRIWHSSNVPEMDSSAIAAVNVCSPFPPVPAELQKDGADIEFEFRYNVNKHKTQAIQTDIDLKNRAQKLFESGDWQSATKILTDALARDPNNKQVAEDLAQIYYDRAQALLAKDPHSPAGIQLLQKSLSIEPGSRTTVDALHSAMGDAVKP